MERQEALAIAMQLLEDPTLGQYQKECGEVGVWSDSALGKVTDLLRSTLAPDGSELPDSLAKGLAAVQKLGDWGFEANEARQIRSIAATLLTYEKEPLRLKRPELSGITSMVDLYMVFCYLRRLWKVKREMAEPVARAQGAAQPSFKSGRPAKQLRRTQEQKKVSEPADPRWQKLWELRQSMQKGKR